MQRKEHQRKRDAERRGHFFGIFFPNFLITLEISRPKGPPYYCENECACFTIIIHIYCPTWIRKDQQEEIVFFGCITFSLIFGWRTHLFRLFSKYMIFTFKGITSLRSKLIIFFQIQILLNQQHNQNNVHIQIFHSSPTVYF